MAALMCFASCRTSTTFSAFKPPFCREPTFTTGMPRYEHSFIPAEELPTRHLEFFKSQINSRGGISFKKRILWYLTWSLKIRISLRTASEPRSAFGQNHRVGVDRKSGVLGEGVDFGGGRVIK